MSGYIKLHRRIVESEIYKMPPIYLRTFERLVLEANHRCVRIPYDKFGSKLIRRGERITTIRDICEWVGWYERGKLKTPNAKTMGDILTWLQSRDMIQIINKNEKAAGKSNRPNTHYTIVNYNDYQSVEALKVTEKDQYVPSNNNDNNNLLSLFKEGRSNMSIPKEENFPGFVDYKTKMKLPDLGPEKERIYYIKWLMDRIAFYNFKLGPGNQESKLSKMELEDRRTTYPAEVFIQVSQIV